MFRRCLTRRPEPEMRSPRKELSFCPRESAPPRARSGGRVLVRAMILALVYMLAAVVSAKDKPPVQYQIPLPKPPDFSALNWLQGRWTGQTTPTSPPGEVQLSVSPGLENHFLVFRGDVSLAATKTAPPTKESWLGILSASPVGTGFILRVFSSTGFITRYRLTVDGAEVHLNPEGGDFPPPGWLFRRTWSRNGTDEFTETVQAAPPGKSFFEYYAAKFARLPSPAELPLARDQAPK